MKRLLSFSEAYLEWGTGLHGAAPVAVALLWAEPPAQAVLAALCAAVAVLHAVGSTVVAAEFRQGCRDAAWTAAAAALLLALVPIGAGPTEPLETLGRMAAVGLALGHGWSLHRVDRSRALRSDP